MIEWKVRTFGFGQMEGLNRCISVDVMVRALRIIDGVYLFYLVLVMEDGDVGGRWLA